MNKFPFLLAVLALALIGAPAAGLAESDDFGGPEITFHTATFSHESHVGGMGFECDACHAGLFEMESHQAQNSGQFTMAAMAKGGYCGACHDGSTAFASNSQCSSCHTKDGGDIIFTQPVEAILFSHQTHGKAGFDCDACHDALFAMKAGTAEQSSNFTMQAFYAGESCGACHDGDTAFASNTRCATCHIGVKGNKKRSPAAAAKPPKAH